MARAGREPVGGHPRRWWVLGVAWLCLLVIGFDVTILNVALPTLSAELEASTSELQWVVDAYVVAFAALLLAAGALGDRIGRKRLLLCGLAAFGAASALAAASTSAGVLIAARALMGVGAAIMAPLTLSILPTVFAPAERPKAIAAWAAGIAIGLPLGPILGGALLEHLWWGSVFLINVPLVAAALAGGAALIPESRDPTARPIDLAGVALSCAGLVALVFGIIEAGQRGWAEGTVVAALAAAALLLCAFVWEQRRAAYPLIELGWFSDLRFFAWVTAATVLATFALFGLLFVLPQYLQFVRGASAIETGLGLLPLMPGLGVGAALSPRLTSRAGTKAVVAAGLVLLAGGLALGSSIGVGTSYWVIAAALAVAGAGTGFALAPAIDGMMSVLPADRFGVGTALNLSFRQVGGALGIALLGSILSSAYAGRLEPSLHGLPAPVRDAAEGSPAASIAIADRMAGPPGEALAAAAQRSFTHGMSVVMLACAAAALVTAALVARCLPPRPRALPPHAAGAAAAAGGARPHAHDAGGYGAEASGDRCAVAPVSGPHASEAAARAPTPTEGGGEGA